MSALDLAAALEAVRLGEATGEHAAVLADAFLDAPSREVCDAYRAELATVRAERDRLLAAAVAQADAAGSPIASRFEGHMAWLAATTATEALGRELRGAR